MVQESGTIPTGRPSIFSANSSASTPSVLSSPRRRKPSHATIRHPRSRSNPMKISLNLVLKVQPMNSDQEQRFSLNKSFGSDEVFYSDNVQQQQQGEYHPYPIYLPTATSTSERSVAKSSASRSSQGSSSSNKKKVHKTRKVSSSKKPRTKSLGTSVRFRNSSPHRTNSNGSVTRVSGAESSASRSSQRSLKRAQTTGNRKNKQPLYSSAMEKPRSKSLTAMPGFQPYPRPRRLSFNVSDALGEAVVVNETIKTDADKTFPLKKSFTNSLGLNDALPRRSSLNGSVISRGSASSAKSSASRSSQGSARKVRSAENRYKNKRSLLTFSSLKKPRSKSLATTSLATSLGTPTRRLSINEVCGTKSRNSAIGLDDNSGSGLNVSAVSAPIDANGSKVSPIFNHQRVVRIGFIANNIPMAVNCVLDIRSDQKILYVEPVEVLYEGFKIWRRSVREVQKEIEEKLAADKKN